MNPFHNRPDEWALFSPLETVNGPVKTMLELGNKINGAVTYKAYFQSLGIEHTSIDWNGKDGALNLDLRKPQWQKFEPFDMVSNIGTTEHISDQAPAWENIHNLVKVGGVLVTMTPAPGDWWWHGEWYPTEGFYQSFAELNGYTLDRCYIDRDPPNRNIYARMTKVENRPFNMPDNSLFYFNKRRPR